MYAARIVVPFEQFRHFLSMKPYDTQITPASRSSALVSHSPHNSFLNRGRDGHVYHVIPFLSDWTISSRHHWVVLPWRQ